MDVDHAVDPMRLVEPLDAGEPPDGRDEEDHARAAGACPGDCPPDMSSPSAARIASAIQRHAEGRAGLRVVAAAEPGGELHHPRPVRPEAHLRVRRAVANAQSFGRRAHIDGAADIVLGRPDVCERDPEHCGGSAVRRSVTVSARNDPSTEKALTVTSGQAVDVLLGYERAVARRLQGRGDRCRQLRGV